MSSSFSQLGYRTLNKKTGTYASGNWVLSFKVKSGATFYSSTGKCQFRLWRSTNSDGSSATEITSGWVQSSTITWSAADQYQTGTATWSSAPSFSLTGEYLFLEVAWWIETGQGSGCTCDITCYGYSACSCNYTCYGFSCSCNAQCYNYGCACQCDFTCYVYTACICDSACYGYLACLCDTVCYLQADTTAVKWAHNEGVAEKLSSPVFTDTDHIAARLVVEGSNYDSSFQSLTSSFDWYDFTWTLNPKSGVAWTTDDLENIGSNRLQKFGYLNSSGSLNSPYVCEAWLIISFDADTCDFTAERCESLGNRNNYGGFFYVTRLAQEELWWGEKRKTWDKEPG